MRKKNSKIVYEDKKIIIVIFKLIKMDDIKHKSSKLI